MTENNTISEVKENTEEVNLLEELSKATEKKEAKTNNASTEEKPINEEKNNFWEMDDMEPEPIVAEEKKPETKIIKTPEEQPKKLTEKAIKHSASVAVGMIELTQSGLMIPILKRKFKKKFTEKEYERFEEVFGKPESSLSDDDKQLIAKMDRAKKKYEEIKKAIPFTSDEEEQLETAFYKYFEYKQIELPPGMHLAFACINVVGKRIIDVVFD